MIAALLMGLLIYSLSSKDMPIEELKQQYTNAYSSFIEIEGMKVHYRDEGQGDVIVLLHGTGASLHTWDAWTKILKENYRVIRMDLPGFGLTGPHSSADYSIDGYTKFILDFTTKIGIQDFYIAGNSLGGSITWNFALNYPNKIKKMVLLDASGYPSNKGASWIFKAARTPVINTVLKYITPEMVIRKNLEQVYFDDEKVTDKLVKRYHELSLRKGNRQAFIDRANTTPIDNSSLIKNLKIETLILWGAEDLWIPTEMAHKFHKDIANSTLVVMKETGHLPMEERPEKSVAIIEQFLEK